jgi:glycosyltransferase involved in cell wall biosynthesis
MRLLFLNHNYRFGGTYYRAMPLAEQLAARNHSVTLMTVSRKHQWRVTWSNVKGVHVAETPNWGQNNSGEGYGPPDNLVRLGHALTHRYDIVHMFDHKPNATFAGLTGRLRGAKLIADWADWWGGAGGINDVPRRRVPAVGVFEQWWEEHSKRWADGVVTISTVLRQRAIDLGIAEDRVLYLPTGAAIDRIRPVQMTEARRQLGIPLERNIVGFIGMGQGDLEIVMNAIRPLSDVWLMVIGARNEAVLAQAEQIGVADRLWQTDYVPDAQVSLYLGCANLMCLPLSDRAANRGRLPNKFLDYLAAGRPVVASPIGDIRTILEQYPVGLLAADAEFGQSIQYLLTAQSTAATMGQKARRVAEEVFAWPGLIDQLVDFYQRVRHT